MSKKVGLIIIKTLVDWKSIVKRGRNLKDTDDARGDQKVGRLVDFVKELES